MRNIKVDNFLQGSLTSDLLMQTVLAIPDRHCKSSSRRKTFFFSSTKKKSEEGKKSIRLDEAVKSGE